MSRAFVLYVIDMKKTTLIYNILLLTISLFCAIISLFSLEFFSQDANWIIVVVSVVLYVVYIFLQIKQYRDLTNDDHIVTHDSKEKVNAFLHKWLLAGGRTIIFTRDLSWADESSEIRKVLEKKANKKELTICLFRSTQTTDKLKSLGAQIIVHGLPENRLKSRFIIVNYGTTNPRVTVGTPKGNGKFQNEIYTVESNPNAVHAFIELFEMVKHNAFLAPHS